MTLRISVSPLSRLFIVFGERVVAHVYCRRLHNTDWRRCGSYNIYVESARTLSFYCFFLDFKACDVSEGLRRLVAEFLHAHS